MSERKIKERNLSNKESFEKAQKHLKNLILHETKKENPNPDLLAAYAALGLCFCEMGELIKGRVAITVSITVEDNGEGDNLVLMLGDENLIENNNDMLIQRIQQEIIQQMHEGGNQ